MKIALDIYGGDNSPYAPIDGAAEFLKVHSGEDIKVLLSGDESLIRRYMSEKGYPTENIEILNAPTEITCHDDPMTAVRSMPDSSMMTAIKAVSEGKADAVVSSGSTGALYMGSILKLKRIKGVSRPALTPLLPTLKNTSTLLIDSGANADCKPEQLAQFAVIGSAYMQAFFGIESPRVALVCNGTEDEKGNVLTKEAHALIKDLPINFVGNVESREALSGNVDVLVCDGFTGNVLLKSIEGTVKAFSSILQSELKSSFISMIGALLVKGRLSNIKKRFDYREVGGAMLLGLSGCVIKAHGSSDATAYKNALEKAKTFTEHDTIGIMTRKMESIAAANADNN